MTGEASLLLKFCTLQYFQIPAHARRGPIHPGELVGCPPTNPARRKLLIEHHGPDRRSAKKSRTLRILGYTLATACLIWVLHDFHIVQAMRELARVD